MRPLQLLRRDLLLAWRDPAEMLGRLLFFGMVISLFPLAMGAEPTLLRRVAPGVIWVAALLATQLALPSLFADDYDDGWLEQMAIVDQSLPAQIFAKICACCLTALLPLALVSPLLGLMFNLEAESLGLATLSLLLGGPALSAIGAVGAALTLGVRGSAVLLALLIWPLYVPVLVFGAGAIEANLAGGSALPHLALLAACSLSALALAPWAAAAAVRLALD